MKQQNEARRVEEIRGGIPELEPHCGSWIVTSPDGKVRELFERANAELAREHDWKVETAVQYLARINHEVAQNRAAIESKAVRS